MDIQREKQEQLIRFLLENWAGGWCEQFVFEQFVRELKERGVTGIPELLHKIRNSPHLCGEYASIGSRLGPIIEAALGTMPLDQVEKMIRKLLPDRAEPK